MAHPTADSVTPDEYRARLAAIAAEADRRIHAAVTRDELELVRVELIGRKSGQFTDLLGQLPLLPLESRKELGAAANELKLRIVRGLADREAALAAAAPPRRARLDLSMPARHSWRGAKHPVTLVTEEI